MAGENKIPFSSDAEMSLLGSLLLDQSLLDTAIELVAPDDFYITRNKDIYESMLSLHETGQSIEQTTLAEALKNHGRFEESGGSDYFTDLELAAPMARNVKAYCQIIKDKSLARQLIYSAQNIIAESTGEYEDAHDLIENAEQKIFNLARGGQKNDFEPIGPILMATIEKFEEIGRNKGKLIGLTTGFKELDEKTSGLQKSDLIIIAARPSMGKTAFALNVATNAALRGKATVLIFSLEMSKEQLVQRMLLSEAWVDSNKVRNGELNNSDDWDSIMGAADMLYETNISIDDTAGISLSEMRSKCRRKKAEGSLDLIVIDYMQLMTGSKGSENRQNEISEISRGLKGLAREMECPVICLSQLARGPESRPNHRPMLSDLRESGSIEQDADVVMFLYRDSYYNKEEAENLYEAELDIAKQRNGPTGMIKLRWIGEITKFTDPAPEYMNDSQEAPFE
ncbi:MAG: replicative DNA helicase [Eubacteriaceae bacterium]|jgi:replicative DNA helicase